MSLKCQECKKVLIPINAVFFGTSTCKHCRASFRADRKKISFGLAFFGIGCARLADRGFRNTLGPDVAFVIVLLIIVGLALCFTKLKRVDTGR